jgi:hypothetical protein
VTVENGLAVVGRAVLEDSLPGCHVAATAAVGLVGDHPTRPLEDAVARMIDVWGEQGVIQPEDSVFGPYVVRRSEWPALTARLRHPTFARPWPLPGPMSAVVVLAVFRPMARTEAALVREIEDWLAGQA